MDRLEQVIPKDIIKGLISSTLEGLKSGDHFYDQFHYVNRKFIDQNLDVFSSIVADAIEKDHPGVTASDLAYVNDFVAPVNLDNAQIHTRHKTNKYEWHVDGIDRSIGPCYNLWIPLYRKSALANLDDRSLFDVLERNNVPELYQPNGDPVAVQLYDGQREDEKMLAVAQQFIGVSKDEMSRSVFYHCKSGKMKIIPKNKLNKTSVIRPIIGDAYIFNSSQIHSSGPSDFERIGISIKFIVKNPKHGFRKVMNENRAQSLPLTSWGSLFVGCYDQFEDFTSFKNYIDFCIMDEKVMTARNQSKVDSVKTVLEEIMLEV